VSEAQPGLGADALVEAWAARVRANREQSERVREGPEPDDFYAPVRGLFVADPRRTDDPTLDPLLELARPGESWLDIGAGAGRYALPLALRVREVIAFDPSEGMLEALRLAMAEYGVQNVRTVHARWPPDGAAGTAPRADVALIAHLGYDIERIGEFLDAMEAAAGRLCVAVLAERVPSAPAAPFWPVVHGEERAELPALEEFLAILRARGRMPAVTYAGRQRRGFASRDALVAWLRNQLFIGAGSAADRRLAAALESRMVAADDGCVGLAPAVESRVGIARWAPPA